MMGVECARGLTTMIDVRIDSERPRPEIQPVRKGRQRQVSAVKHGDTLASAAVGRDQGETTWPGSKKGPVGSPGKGRLKRPLFRYRVFEPYEGLRDVDETERRTRSDSVKTRSLEKSKRAMRASLARRPFAGPSGFVDTLHRQSIERIGSRKIGKNSGKAGDRRLTPRDSEKSTLGDDLEALIQQHFKRRISIPHEQPFEFWVKVRKVLGQVLIHHVAVQPFAR